LFKSIPENGEEVAPNHFEISEIDPFAITTDEKNQDLNRLRDSTPEPEFDYIIKPF
jgi:hypothetical protein